MASTKKGSTKPPKSRPVATSAISQPAVQDSTNTAALSSFSPNGNLFAFLSLAVDKHRLRVYDSSSGKSVAENVFDVSRVTALVWGQVVGADSTDDSPSKKKRRKTADDQSAEKATLEAIILGMSDGTILVFSPTHGRTMRTLSNPKSTTAILSVVVDKNKHLWTSSADGTVRLWDLESGNITRSHKSDDRIPYSSIAMRPSDLEDDSRILAAHHSIHLLSLDKKISEVASFPGHASPVKILQWDASQVPANRFVSLAEGDRVVSVWELPRDGAKQGKLVASVQLDADARLVALQNTEPSSRNQTLLTLSSSGRISIYPIPNELTPPPKSPHKVSTLLPRSTLAVPPSKNTSGAQLIGVTFSAGSSGSIRIVRLVGGVKPVFDLVHYLEDGSDTFITDVAIDDVPIGLLTEGTTLLPNKRYAENNSMAIGSGAELGHAEELEDMARPEGELDAELAELSLGQRLTQAGGKQNEISVVPAASLTRTLLQALHSSDSRLMETCLAHSDPVLIRNTIKALPPQLAVPLLMACMDRLSRGARAGNMKGGGGGASSQRGASLITWVKTVLTIHSGHLMTMPDLVARLSGLHATLTSRLALQENLLSLSGRLDMVLSQIEMRSSTVPAPLVAKKDRPAKDKSVKKYVEGESDEDEDVKMDVEVEVDSDDNGSVEDVELGGDDSDEESEEEAEDSDEDEDEDNSDDSEGPVQNGFIDDEAEEYSDEDSDSE
ncbi:WD40 repeat-like protein [Hymenopellis radicata]|nr:WD40 repeat-like protein [Hymenopellis radicata]